MVQSRRKGDLLPILLRRRRSLRLRKYPQGDAESIQPGNDRAFCHVLDGQGRNGDHPAGRPLIQSYPGQSGATAVGVHATLFYLPIIMALMVRNNMKFVNVV